GVRTQSSGHPVGLQSVPGGPLRRDPPSARRLRARDRGARGRCHAGLARPRGPYRRPPADAPAEPVPPGQRRNRDRRLHRGTGGDALGRGSRRPRRRPGEPVPRRAAARAPRRDDGADLDLRRESPALGHGAWKRGDPACAEPGRPLATGSAAAPRAGRGPAGRRLLLLEREPFPRLPVGESLLPATLPILERMGVLSAVAAHGFQVKYGATFFDQEGDYEHTFYFLTNKPWPSHAYQVHRAD